ncbi:Extracellular serine proteinase [Nosema bombycis CQ1]|uniref:Extracellular serine proteinase n=2 Tax=Nosema bombycis TaxID=27978 RepID=R0MAG3_NOSB1|nr:subtilisin-like protease 2-1 [Nosema bombycis]EOB14934.1 Extracellular serine proteinase [Nosema bombycis CQ1]|eukprot:EOB14934.1 Extracellular serine proteinase [Nosema bombycis CQ1]
MLFVLLIFIFKMINCSNPLESSKQEEIISEQQGENGEDVIIKVITTTTVIEKEEQLKTECSDKENEPVQNINEKNDKDIEVNPCVDKPQPTEFNQPAELVQPEQEPPQLQTQPPQLQTQPPQQIVVVEPKTDDKKCFIVKATSDSSSIKELLESKNVLIKHLYTKNLNGFSFCVDDSLIVDQLRNEIKGGTIVEDYIYTTSAIQYPISRHLFLINNYLNTIFNNYFYDNILFRLLFIDKLFRYLFGSYNYNYTGKGTRLYLLDTTVNAKENVFNISNKTKSCNNHGNTIVSLIKNPKKGYSRDAEVFVLDGVDCNGRIRLSGILQQLEQLSTDGRPTVLLFGVSGPYSVILNEIVDRLSSKGIIVISPAGNKHDNSCYYSPGSAKSSLTVGSLNKHANISQFSNYGSCVRLFALGEELNFRNTIKGSSFSAANVASAVLIYLEKHPKSTFPEVWRFLDNNSHFKNNTHLVFRIPSEHNRRTSSTNFYTIYINYIVPIITLIVIILIIYWICKMIRKRKERKHEEVRKNSREYILEPNIRHYHDNDLTTIHVN